MHSTAEGEPILEPHGRPRERPIQARRVPQPGRISQDGPPVQEQKHVEERAGKVHRLLRHRLTSPEKRTVKRIEAQRSELFGGSAPPSVDVVRARILAQLRDDRGLKQGIQSAEAYALLSQWLVDESLCGRAAAEIIGLFLREVGAMERPELSAPRVKAALRVVNEVLFGDDQDAPIPLGVREFRLEKRDGGLQIVAHLRAGADEASVAASCRKVLDAAGYKDVDVRLVSRHVQNVGQRT
jgi:hypothetical protein